MNQYLGNLESYKCEICLTLSFDQQIQDVTIRTYKNWVRLSVTIDYKMIFMPYY